MLILLKDQVATFNCLYSPGVKAESSHKYYIPYQSQLRKAFLDLHRNMDITVLVKFAPSSAEILQKGAWVKKSGLQGLIY